MALPEISQAPSVSESDEMGSAALAEGLSIKHPHIPQTKHLPIPQSKHLHIPHTPSAIPRMEKTIYIDFIVNGVHIQCICANKPFT